MSQTHIPKSYRIFIKSEPVYITKHGKGGIVVMDINTYDELVKPFELSRLLDQGLEDLKEKDYKNADEFFDSLEGMYKDVML